ncbi:tape measure protein [Vibrio breoganii]|uniref:tape measure protein n=1 Tax=Vibrio breoganii TaxID=553239 RepID=UPI000C862144|nr:tape measure protein [Vibrio breoganii]PMK30667.1 hypothetical protein BCU03_09635 [Vibrio breoganii]
MADTERIYKLTVDAKQAIAQLEKLNKTTAKSEKSLASMAKVLNVGAGFAIAKGAFESLGRSMERMTNATKKFENMQIQLRSFASDSGDAAAAFDQIFDASQKGTASLEEVQRAFVNLQAVGKDATKYLDAFNAAASASSDSAGTFQAFTDLVTRTVSGGLGLEDLNRLVDRGVPAFKILDDKLGVTRTEIVKFGASAEGAGKVVDALVEGIREKFGSLNDLKLDSLETITQHSADSMERMLATISDASGLTNSWKNYMADMGELSNRVSENLKPLAELNRQIREISVTTGFESSTQRRILALQKERAALDKNSQAWADKTREQFKLQQDLDNQKGLGEQLTIQRDILNEMRIQYGAITIEQARLSDNPELREFAAKWDKAAESVKAYRDAAKEANNVIVAEKVGIKEGDLKKIRDFVAALEKANRTPLEKLGDSIKTVQGHIDELRKYGDKYTDTIKALLVQLGILQQKQAKIAAEPMLKQKKSFDDLMKSIEALNKTSDKFTSIQERINKMAHDTASGLKMQQEAQEALNKAMAVAAQNEANDNFVSRMSDYANATNELEASIAPAISNLQQYKNVVAEIQERLENGTYSQIEFNKQMDNAKEHFKINAQGFSDMDKSAQTFSVNIQKALGKIVVSGIKDLGDSIWDMATKGKASFADLATSVIDSIGRMLTQMALLKGMGSIFGTNGAGNIDFSNIFDEPLSIMKSNVSLSAFPTHDGNGNSLVGSAPPADNYSSNDSLVTLINKQRSAQNASSNSGSVNVVVNNNASGIQTNVSQKQDASGARQLIIDVVKGGVESGELDDTMTGAFGLVRQGW